MNTQTALIATDPAQLARRIAAGQAANDAASRGRGEQADHRLGPRRNGIEQHHLSRFGALVGIEARSRVHNVTTRRRVGEARKDRGTSRCA